MSVESTSEVMTAYFDSGHADTSMMAEDVCFTIMASGQEHKTPEGVLQMLQYFYHVAFEATGEASKILFADGGAVWEGIFVGKHTGEFAGIPATGKDVRVPLCVIYDLEDDRITRGRVYFEMSALMAQLGVSN